MVPATLGSINADPGRKIEIPRADSGDFLRVRFSEKNAKATFVPPKYFEAGSPVNLTSPVQQEIDRYTFYGIVTGTRVLPVGQGLGFQTALADDDEKIYYVSPAVAEEFKFGKTGPFKAVVGMVTGPSSVYCDSAKDDAPNANITRSDEFQLRFTVKTDICVYDAATDSAHVVDRMDAEFVLPFGRNYFRETAPSDVVTPGTELYIDEFLRDAALFGIPISPTVLLSDGTYPATLPNTGGDGDTSGGGDQKKSGTPECVCTCEEYERIMKVLNEASKNKSQDRKLLSEVYCMQKCRQEFQKCYLK